jgi:hypothetical protein
VRTKDCWGRGLARSCVTRGHEVCETAGHSRIVNVENILAQLISWKVLPCREKIRQPDFVNS